jgi:hypothetical protein
MANTKRVEKKELKKYKKLGMYRIYRKKIIHLVGGG